MEARILCKKICQRAIDEGIDRKHLKSVRYAHPTRGYFDMLPIRSDKIHKAGGMHIGKKSPTLDPSSGDDVGNHAPPMFEGLWWMKGNPAPEYAVTFACGDWVGPSDISDDNPKPTARIEVWKEKLWSFPQSFLGHLIYDALELQGGTVASFLFMIDGQDPANHDDGILAEPTTPVSELKYADLETVVSLCEEGGLLQSLGISGWAGCQAFTAGGGKRKRMESDRRMRSELAREVVICKARRLCPSYPPLPLRTKGLAPATGPVREPLLKKDSLGESSTDLDVFVAGLCDDTSIVSGIIEALDWFFDFFGLDTDDMKNKWTSTCEKFFGKGEDMIYKYDLVQIVDKDGNEVDWVDEHDKKVGWWSQYTEFADTYSIIPHEVPKDIVEVQCGQDGWHCAAKKDDSPIKRTDWSLFAGGLGAG
eukprot:gene57966-biopygen14033